MLMRSPRSGMLVRASTTAPAARICSTGGASALAMKSFKATRALIRRVARDVEVDLHAEGHAVQRPERRRPTSAALSAASASASTSSGRTSTTAFTAPFTCSMRARCALDDLARGGLPTSNRVGPASRPTPATVHWTRCTPQNDCSG